MEYMAPEQCRRKSLDGRADLYSLGVILYEWLARVRPLRVRGGNVAEFIGQVETAAPDPLNDFRPDLPPRVVSLVHDLLDKSAERRPDAASVASRCDEILKTLD
jgi:serine/threonine-protein kinase